MNGRIALMKEVNGETNIRAVIGDVSKMDTGELEQLYFRSMAEEPLLSFKEEIMLAKKMEEGVESKWMLSESKLGEDERVRLMELVAEGDEARDRMIRANTRLVVSIAKHYLGNMPLVDLIGEGNIGLIRAVDKYEWRRGWRLSTYATWWIKQAITRAISQKTRLIRMPGLQIEKLNMIYAQVAKMEGSGGNVDYAKVADKVNEGLKEGQRIDELEIVTLMAVDGVESLNMKVGNAEIGDLIVAEDEEGPEEEAQRALFSQKLLKLLSNLGSRHARTLSLRFGLEEGRAMTLEQIGELCGLSRERVRQIEKEALRELRKMIVDDPELMEFFSIE